MPLIRCPSCGRQSFDPWADACERRRCGYVVTTTPRQRGDYFERKVRAELSSFGYVTVRSSGSSGPFDVLAFRGTAAGATEVVLVQAKSDGRLDPGPWNALLALADETYALAVLAQRTLRTIEYRRLLARKGPDRAAPLWEPWQPVAAFGW